MIGSISIIVVVVFDNFVVENTYFIPKNYNNDRLSPRHIEFIQDKIE